MIKKSTVAVVLFVACSGAPESGSSGQGQIKQAVADAVGYDGLLVGDLRLDMAIPRFVTFEQAICYKNNEAKVISGEAALELITATGYGQDDVAVADARRVLGAEGARAVLFDSSKIDGAAADFIFIPRPRTLNFDSDMALPGEWIEVRLDGSGAGGACYTIKTDSGMNTHTQARCHCTKNNALCCPGDWTCQAETTCDPCTPSMADPGTFCAETYPFEDITPFNGVVVGSYL